MANIIRNFIDSLHLADDDETDEEYEEYLAETNERERRRTQRNEKRFDKPGRRYAQDEVEDIPETDYRQNTSNFSDIRKERSAKAEKQQSARIVPFRNSAANMGSAMGIKVMKPTSFGDSQAI